jgi:phospholipid/cholesterol/gamma-HCH transport system substrate-binding protein
MRKAVIAGVGVFVVLSALGLWLAESLGLLPGYAQLRAYTDDASGLTDGTKVRLDGIPIGYLDHQRLTGSRDPQRRVEFDMKVKSSYLPKIPVDSVVGVAADNLLGDKAINITVGNSQQHVEPGALLRSVQAVDPNKLMAQMGNELQDFQKVVDRANNLLAGVDAGRGSVGMLKNNWASKWGGLPAEGRSMLADFRNAHGSMNKLLVDNDELTNQVQATRRRIDDIMGGLQAGQGTAGKLRSLDKDLEQTMQEIEGLKAAVNARTGDLQDLQQRIDLVMARFNGIVDKINAGQGAIGQFAVNPQLSEALAGTTDQFQGMVKDLRANPKKFFTFRLALF